MIVASAAASGCRKSEQTAEAPAPAREVLDFPAELQASDESVNAFIRQVIDVCVSGDYDAFRLLWSARDDPFPRDQFYKAWQSVQQVTIVSLRPARDRETDRLYYAVAAHVELDPSVREPQRDVKILFSQEEGQWRLTARSRQAPDALFEPPGPTSRPASSSQPSEAP